MDAQKSVPLLFAGIVASAVVLATGIASGWSPFLWIVATLPIAAQLVPLASLLRQRSTLDVRALVVPMLFLAALGVLLPIAIPNTNWLGVVGWAVALTALTAAYGLSSGRRDARIASIGAEPGPGIVAEGQHTELTYSRRSRRAAPAASC